MNYLAKPMTAHLNSRTKDLVWWGNRVGCAPCINSGREDIRNWAMRFPAMIDKLRGWEERTKRTFFAPMVPGKYINSVDDVVAWAMCDTGGRQQLFPVLIERQSCERKYGLCE